MIFCATFPLFEEIVKECKESHIFFTGRKKYYVFITDELGSNKVEKVYRYMGLPGCLGSMDVTHVQWGVYPSALRHYCIGSYGYPPILGFNFVCSHNRRIRYVSKAFYGATNDITIA